MSINNASNLRNSLLQNHRRPSITSNTSKTIHNTLPVNPNLSLPPNQLLFRTELTIKSLSDVPFVDGKFWCKVRLKTIGFQTLQKYFSVSKNAPKINNTQFITPDAQIKQHKCIWKHPSFDFELPMQLEQPGNQVKSQFLRVSVRGHNQKKNLKSVNKNVPNLEHSSISEMVGHGEIKLGYVDIDLAEYCTGQTMQGTYLLEQYDNQRASNSTLSIEIKLIRIGGNKLYLPRPLDPNSKWQITTKTVFQPKSEYTITDEKCHYNDSVSLNNSFNHGQFNINTDLQQNSPNNIADLFAEVPSHLQNSLKQDSKSSLVDYRAHDSIPNQLENLSEDRRSDFTKSYYQNIHIPQHIVKSRSNVHHVVDEIFEELQDNFYHLQSRLDVEEDFSGDYGF